MNSAASAPTAITTVPRASNPIAASAVWDAATRLIRATPSSTGTVRQRQSPPLPPPSIAGPFSKRRSRDAILPDRGKVFAAGDVLGDRDDVFGRALGSL